jgi:hypothetical protein
MPDAYLPLTLALTLGLNQGDIDDFYFSGTSN